MALRAAPELRGCDTNGALVSNASLASISKGGGPCRGWEDLPLKEARWRPSWRVSCSVLRALVATGTCVGDARTESSDVSVCPDVSASGSVRFSRCFTFSPRVGRSFVYVLPLWEGRLAIVFLPSHSTCYCGYCPTV